MITAGMQRAKELLAKPINELYTFYVTNIASDFVKAKTKRGINVCFHMWLADLKRDTVEV